MGATWFSFAAVDAVGLVGVVGVEVRLSVGIVTIVNSFSVVGISVFSSGFASGSKGFSMSINAMEYPYPRGLIEDDLLPLKLLLRCTVFSLLALVLVPVLGGATLGGKLTSWASNLGGDAALGVNCCLVEGLTFKDKLVLNDMPLLALRALDRRSARESVLLILGPFEVFSLEVELPGLEVTIEALVSVLKEVSNVVEESFFSGDVSVSGSWIFLP